VSDWSPYRTNEPKPVAGLPPKFAHDKDRSHQEPDPKPKSQSALKLRALRCGVDIFQIADPTVHTQWAGIRNPQPQAVDNEKPTAFTRAM
jgi:hypothetical protein